MKTLITVAALALGLAAPALAQDAKPAVTPPIAPAAKPAEAPKATPATTKERRPARAKSHTTRTPRRSTRRQPLPWSLRPSRPKADAGKGDTPKTTEKPSDTKKQ